MKHFSYLTLFIILLAVTVFASCKTQNLRYNEIKTSEDSLYFFGRSHVEHVIQPDDKLNLSIHDHDDLSIGSVYSIYNANEVYSRWILIDPQGFAALPRIGQTQLAGMSVSEAQDTLTSLYGKWIVNPIVRLRILNKQVSVLGEVKTPGLLILEKESNTLAETLARAGDMEFYADKRKVQVVRMVNDTLKSFTIDLTDPKNSEMLKLSVKPGDIVYVPSRRGKVWDKRSGSILTVTGVVTTLAIISQLFK